MSAIAQALPPLADRCARFGISSSLCLNRQGGCYNFYNPTGACNVTSMAMCLQFIGKPRRDNVGQFEDELYEYTLNKGLNRWSPYDLAKLVVDYGAKDTFKDNAVIEEVQDWLTDGKPVVIHGYFTSFGHIMPVVGYDETGLYVNDPYGEWFPDWI